MVMVIFTVCELLHWHRAIPPSLPPQWLQLTPWLPSPPAPRMCPVPWVSAHVPEHLSLALGRTRHSYGGRLRKHNRAIKVLELQPP